MGYASYSLTILLPKHSNKLALEIPDTYSSYRLFVNGEIFANTGIPDSTATTAALEDFKTLELSSNKDTLHLILQVANLAFKGGPYKDIILGDRDTLFHKKQWIRPLISS